MNQTKLESVVEVVLSTALGFVVSALAWPFVAIWQGLPYDLATNFSITAFFTALSLTRGYLVRRVFNHGFHQVVVGITERVSRWV